MGIVDGIKDRVAIVVGGATSIGAEIVRAFCDCGARVAIADIEEQAGELLASQLSGKALFSRMDLRSDDDIRSCVDRAVAAFGRVDFVVNCACPYLDKGPDSTRADWLEALNVNVVGGAMVVQAARPHLRESKGAVVNVGSISAKVAQKGRWTYPVSKAAVHQLTRNQALDFAGDGIRVNTVSPGWTWSGAMEKVVGDNRAAIDQIAAKFHLIARAANRREIADAVLFLCSRHATFITGAELPVDGGYTAIGPEQKDAPVS